MPEHDLATVLRETRLRAIEEELGALRREQRLFRQLGFGENVKVMQVVALQTERQDLIDGLRAAGHRYDHATSFSRARATTVLLLQQAVLAIGLTLCVARTIRSGSIRPRQRRVTRPMQREVSHLAVGEQRPAPSY